MVLIPTRRSPIQLRERHRPRRHRVRRISAPRRRRGFRQVEENLAVHVALLVARHGLRAVLGEFGHFDGFGAGGAFALGGDDGESGVDEEDGEEGAVLERLVSIENRV